MNRPLIGTLSSLFLSLALAACSSDSNDVGPAAGSGGFISCQAFTSCQSCTPQYGCGWCYNSDGTGQCAAGPDECVTPAFEWTWNSNGCRVPAEASVEATDAGSDASAPIVTMAPEAGGMSSTTTSDGGTSSEASTATPGDAAPGSGLCLVPPGADTLAEIDGGATGCSVTSLNLCAAATFGLACQGDSTPTSSLGCQILPIPSPSSSLFYCCPCGG